MTIVTLIADGCADAGLGHLSRSSALVLALHRAGCRTSTLGLGLESPIERHGISWQPTTEPGLVSSDVIVIDSYRATSELRARLASIAPVVAFADDDQDVPDAALVIRSGPEADRKDELNGLSYACLSPEFWSCPSPELRPDVRRVLVTTGGGDHTGIGPSLAIALRNALPNAEITLVRGPYATPIGTLDGIRIVLAPGRLFTLLIETDLLVGAAGQTILEAFAAGTPCVALATADNQVRQAAELRSIGAVTVATSVEEAASASCALAADFGVRRKQAFAGQAAVDGQGALRVANAVLELSNRDVRFD